MNRFLKPFSLLFVPFLILSAPRAQVVDGSGTPLYIGSQRVPVQFTVGGIAQRYEDGDADLQQLAIPFTAFVPVMRDVGLSVRAWYASSEGSDVAPLSGLADAQLALSYHRALGAGSAVGSLSVNLPSGNAAIAPAKAETAFLIGQGFYDFRLPTLGQGFNVTPGLTYALPLGARLAFGLGASYQYRGPFEPRADSDTEYDPSDEVLVTAGLDYRLTDASSLSLDGSFVHYEEDTWGDLAYTTGDAFSATAQWAATLGLHEVRVLGRVRHKTESTIPPETALLLGLDAAIPNQGRLLGHARLRLSERFRLGAFTQGRYYAASEVFEEKALFDVGVLPEYEMGQGIALTGQLGATLGDLQGFELGVGLSWGL